MDAFIIDTITNSIEAVFLFVELLMYWDLVILVWFIKATGLRQRVE